MKIEVSSERCLLRFKASISYVPERSSGPDPTASIGIACPTFVPPYLPNRPESLECSCGNTADNNLVEISPSTGKVVGQKVVDTGATGAIATSGTSLATQKIYFNDDKTNTVVELSK